LRKGCAAVSGLLVLILGVGGSIGFGKVNEQYGLLASPTITHAAYTDAETGLQVSLEPAHARDLIVALLPPDVAMPAWVPMDVETALDQLMPREVALLASPDYAAGQLRLVVFMNEKRLGPQLVQALNNGMPPAARGAVQWEKQRFTLAERGAITARAAVALPAGFEEELLRRWPPRRRPVTIRAEGGHLLEAVLDNRCGDAFMLWATAVTAGGANWRNGLTDSRFQQALELLVYVDEARLTADLEGNDTLKVDIDILADPSVGSNLVAVFNFMLPTPQTMLRSRYGLTLEGEFTWDEAERTIAGDFTLTGLYAELVRQRDQMLQARRPSAAGA